MNEEIKIISEVKEIKVKKIKLENNLINKFESRYNTSHV